MIQHSRTLLRLSSCLALLAAACSSGGGSSGGAGTSHTRVLVLDTRVGGAYVLDLRVDVAVLEDASGAITNNLVPAGTTLPIARPSGTSGGVRLPLVPTGAYAALRLLVSDGGAVATDASGAVETVVIPSRDLRVPLTGGVGTVDSTVRWLVLGHTGTPAVTRDLAGRLQWTPSLAARLGDAHTLSSTDLAVASIHGGGVLGTLSSCGDLPVNGRIDDSTRLSDDSGPCDRSRFFGGMRSGDHLECEGVLTSTGEFRLSHAHRRGRGEGEAKIYGRLLELLPAVPAIRVQVQEIVRGGQGLGTPLPVLTVLTASAFIHRSGQRDVRLDFSALAVDQRVEVEWRGAVQNSTVTAHEVEIEDGAGSGMGNEIEGQVGSIDLAQGLITALPRGNDPLVVGGQRVTSATIVVGAQTVLHREEGTTRRIVTLAEARTGDRIWVIGRVAAPQRVEATVVRLRAQ